MPYKDKAKRNRSANQSKARKVTALILEAKDTPCADCGHRFPHYIMEFDHLPGTTKNKSKEIKNMSFPDAWEEILKCEVVCGNCHNARTWFRRQFGNR